MFVLFYFCVTSISWLTFESQATETDCDENCADYHRLCPAVKNPTYYEEYSAKHASGQLGISSNRPLPPPPDCDTGFYQYACPRSCEICKTCEMENSYIPRADQPLYVTSGTAPTPWSSSEDIQFGYTKEGETLTPDTCYHSESKKDQKAILDIPLADVTKVELLNRDHVSAANTKGEVVYVCMDGTENCEQCPPSYSVAGKGAWLPYDCPRGTKGNTILVYHTSFYTIFCEVKVVGTRLL